MPTVRYAHLLLPSAQGLLEYDVLEDAVFVGPGPRGGLTAKPQPFQEAKIALTRTEAGYTAKPLPGESAPEINGQQESTAILADGDRIKIGDQIVLFRTDRGPIRQRPADDTSSGSPRTAAASGGTSRRGPGGEGRSARPRRSYSGTLLSLLGAALLLAAAVRAAGHLKSIQKGRDARVDMSDTPRVLQEQPSRAARHLNSLRDFERAAPDRIQEAVKRYHAFAEHHPGDAEVEVAQERVRELMERWGQRESLVLEEQVDLLLGTQHFERAARAVRKFEARFGATRAGPRSRQVSERVRAAAEVWVAEIKRQAKVLTAKNPKLAVRLLADAIQRVPADMAADLSDLLVVARDKLKAERGDRRPARTPRKPKEPVKPPTPPGADAEPKDPQPAPDSGDAGPAPSLNAEARARGAWASAHEDLVAGKYADALLGYTLLIQRFGRTTLYTDNKAKIQAGLRAARVGKDGPKALLSVEATEKKGRLEFEYTFGTVEQLEDWDQEKPFSSENAVDIEQKLGGVSMAGTSGLLHPIVFLPDVRVEVNLTADVAHDFGIIAMEHSDDFRAVLFNVNNKRFTLKKGANARPSPGHLLWYIGQGVWSSADADAHGYIKIAERTVSKLKDGERVLLEFERGKGGRCEASLGSRSDGVNLKGRVKGDDGSTMGSARVGVFVNTGIVRVHQVKISGLVDMSWFNEHLQWLVKGDPGPKPK